MVLSNCCAALPRRGENGGWQRKFRMRRRHGTRASLTALMGAAARLMGWAQDNSGNPMARAKSKPKIVAAASSDAKASKSDVKKEQKGSDWSEMFSRVSCVIAHWMGKPIAFLIAAALVIIWAFTGPLFNYSDTWQLVINTSTTIITFLMVFLIQNTQNRDTMALQLKLSELILVIGEAENRFAGAEDMSEQELEKLHEELRRRTEATLGALNQRRSGQKKAG
jgi:low affinity Fe/Cu permease